MMPLTNADDNGSSPLASMLETEALASGCLSTYTFLIFLPCNFCGFVRLSAVFVCSAGCALLSGSLAEKSDVTSALRAVAKTSRGLICRWCAATLSAQ